MLETLESYGITWQITINQGCMFQLVSGKVLLTPEVL